MEVYSNIQELGKYNSWIRYWIQLLFVNVFFY